MKIALIADAHVKDDGPGLSLLRQAAEAVRDVDRVVVAGDLVDTGSDSEYAAVAGLTREWDVLPGNHEMIEGDHAGFAKAFDRVPRKVEWEGTTVLLLNTALDEIPPERWYGRLCDESRAMLRDAIDPQSREPLIVVMHHPFAGTLRAAPYPMMSQIEDVEERALLAIHGGQIVVFSGHAHRADLRREGRVTYVGCPPLCFWPHALLRLTLDRHHLAVDTLRLTTDQVDSPDEKLREGERHLTASEYQRECEPVVPAFTLRLR